MHGVPLLGQPPQQGAEAQCLPAPTLLDLGERDDD